ncbi:MAG: four helix bundle protein [bacterium]|nr:four helix bundle protein [bacterium]
MGKISSWRELVVWQKTHSLVLLTYRLTACFPAEEKFALVSQMRRAAVSIASNIVEGFKRQTARDSINFYNIAAGSLEELKYQYFLSKDLGYMADEQYQETVESTEEVGKLLYAWTVSQKVNSADR